MKKISIIMGVYNNASTLSEAIDSILAQTYTNWQFVICDDCSIDGSYDIVLSYKERYPEKFIVIKNDVNRGLNYTLNRCLEFADGEYIARMDGDDISVPERFDKQVSFLAQHKDIAIVSSDMDFFDENGVWGKTNVKERPVNKDFLYATPFCHAAVMVKKEAYKDVGGYSVDKKLLRVEDYHLWTKMYVAGYCGMNIQESLYKMRDDRNAQRRRKFKYRLNEAYVKAYAIKNLKLPIYGYLYCLKPILLGLVPSFVYKFLHRKKNV